MGLKIVATALGKGYRENRYNMFQSGAPALGRLPLKVSLNRLFCNHDHSV